MKHTKNKVTDLVRSCKRPCHIINVHPILKPSWLTVALPNRLISVSL